MKVAIVNTLPVPSGNASVNRFLGYAKGLVQQGVSVDVLSSSSFEDSVLDGVNIYSCGREVSLLRALYIMIKHVRKGGYNTIIVVSNSLFLIYPLVLACRIHKVKIVQEKSEYPFVLMNKGFFNSGLARLYVNTTYRLFDGLIVMTSALEEYFDDKINKHASIFVMPMTVDTDRFLIPQTKTKYGDYIAYCGNMAGNKDGVMNLINAFDLASQSIGDVKLLLIGSSSNREDWDNIVELVKQTNNEKIVLYGTVSREDIPSLLKNAKALALARPSCLQSAGGFPTKLGEYLATGNPVIVTAVGDIPNYLNDTNAFVVAPDDNVKFACAIKKVFSNYEQALNIGVQGQKLAQTVFSAKKQSERLFNYLEGICG